MSYDWPSIERDPFPSDAPCEIWTPSDGERETFFMTRALVEARIAAEEGEIPIGAVVVWRDRIVARDHNRREQLRDPTAHAETLALRQAARFYPSWRIEEAEMFVTLEPCLMCSGAILASRVERLFVGTRDPKGGAALSLYRALEDPRLNWRVEIVENVMQAECSAILKDFFRARRLRGTKT